MKYEKMFQKGKNQENWELKNRIVMPAMGVSLGHIHRRSK